MGDLTTLATVKQALRLASTTDDTLISRMITTASETMLSWLNRPILSAPFTDTFDGNGGSKLVLPNYPVTAIASVTVDGQSIPPSVSLSQGFLFTSTLLLLRGYTLNQGMQNVQVSYTAGYAVAPPPLAQACIELVSHKYRELERIGQISKAIGGETVSFLVTDFPPSVKSVLTNFMKVTPS